MLETIGGFTDSAEAVVSIIQKMAPDLRVVVPNAAKSNGTLICLAGKSIVMGAPSELGPVEPHINQIPSTILIDPAIAAQNFVLHKQGEFALSQTRKVATQLLTAGMMNGKTAKEISDVVEKLLTRRRYPSHGSVIDYKEAIDLGFAVEYLPPEDELWQRFRLLACMYQSDARKNRYLKVFEGSARSAAIEVPVLQTAGTPAMVRA